MSPSPLFTSEKEPNSTERLIGTSRHSALPPPRNRGRPARKRGGLKRRLSEESGDDVPLLTTAPRLSESPVPHSCSSESSEEADDYNEEMGARSPPVLTKPTLGLKSKVGENQIWECFSFATFVPLVTNRAYPSNQIVEAVSEMWNDVGK